MNNNHYYKTKLKETEVKLNKLYNKSKLYSNLRLSVFLISAIICFFLFYNNYLLTGISFCLISLIIFLFVVSKHTIISNNITKNITLKKIYTQYLSRIDGSWNDFDDTGTEYVDTTHHYSSDLDIFGDYSLFQLINVTTSYYGREKLKNRLISPLKNISDIIETQSRIEELSTKNDFCVELQCEGQLNNEISNKPDALIELFSNNSNFSNKNAIRFFIIALPFITFFTFFTALISSNIPFTVPFLFISIQIIFAGYSYININSTLDQITNYSKSILTYNDMFNIISNEDFQDKYLSKLQSELTQSNISTKKLTTITVAIEFRKLGVFYIIPKILFLWDYHCFFAIEKWKETYGLEFKKNIDILGEFEMLSSFAVLNNISDNVTFPTLEDEAPFVKAINLGHPLIPEESRICNSIDMSNTNIITGSNMSGKTTFLRTLGINLVLAYCGAPVFAKEFSCSLMNIYTSMRIKDDLSGGISTFYAELKRIKIIISEAKKKCNMIFLLDELFRGTNSHDRLIGSKNIITQLTKDYSMGLVSTHDFQLCNLEKDSSSTITNYHFKEHYIDNNLTFDYKIHSGRCNTSNAIHLMKMVGIDII